MYTRDLCISKIDMIKTQKRPKCTEKRPIYTHKSLKYTQNDRNLQKRPTKEAYQKTPKRPTYKQKRPM